ncbi:MAG: ATP-dependent helicase, partial [Deltaproteobacteria bacterium]|nr:ATP-dependent helicase [Deltaproteobacteria bacterium]
MERTESQKRAIESVTQPTAVIAGAGSGKTEILTGRLLHILEHTTTTLHQILAVTFTDKSALELKRRIASQLPEESRDLLPFASIGTIHSFCLNLLQEQAPLIGLHDRVNVWDEHTTHLHIHQAARQTVLAALDRKEVAVLEMVEELDFPQMLILLEDLMNARWHAERVLLRSKSGDEKEERFLQATKNLYNETRERYDRFKRERSALDFQDLEILTLQLLTQNAGVRKIVQERFTHILVDEAQDLNDLQRELLQIIFNPKTNCLCIVGDPKQSIYRFRGANVENFKILVGMIREAGGIEVSLNENFRSRPEILALINKTFEPIFSADFFTPLLPTKEPSDSPAIHVLSIPTPEETDAESLRKAESALIAARIEEMVAAGEAKYADFVLLFSSLNDIRYYEMALRHHDIPYRRFGGGGFLNAQEVCDLLFVLKILQDPADKRSLVGLMRSPLLGIPDTEIVKLCDDTGSLWEKLLERPEACWLKTLAEKKEDLRGYQILEEAILETHYDTLLEKLDPSGTKLANLEQLLDITRSLELEDERSLAEVIEHFEELKKQKRSIGLAT